MKRADGRKNDETRPVVMRVGVVEKADGSAYVQLGKTMAIAAVYGPREMHPKHKQNNQRATLQVDYKMAPFATGERARPGPSRRSREISKVTKDALQSVLFLDEFPKTAIDVYIVVIQANAGTRTAGINAASLALADAGIPMKDLVASIAAGKIGNDYVLDLAGKEEEETECDLPVAYSPRLKKVTLLQMDGDMPAKDVTETMKLAIKSCEKLYEIQRKALLEKWKEREGSK